MLLSCQKNSYLKELEADVVSCESSQFKIDKKKVQGYEVVLSDTVLFPEGGGQPDDRGRIGDVPVLRVEWRHDKAIHFTEQRVEVGARVHVVVDWVRRFDHMQQHTGQHLITAVADGEYGYQTTSWVILEAHASGASIDLRHTPSRVAGPQEQVVHLEDLINEHIMKSVTVTVVRARGLPDGHVGPIRVISIDGIDCNMCGGTHLSNLSHLQTIKLLGVEKGKKGKTNLLFVAGERVRKYLAKCVTREKQLTSILKAGPDQHAELTDKLQKSLRLATRNSLSLLRDVAVLEAQRHLRSGDQTTRLFSLHRKEGDVEFMNIVANEISEQNKDTLMFLTVGDEKESGFFLLSGPQEAVSSLGSSVCTALEGKGAGKAGRFQGKAGKLSKRGEALRIIEEYMRQTQAEK
ncbi:PREDICTED: alanyl-tRNA editing protein Aarsd1-B-like [Priapulus caudatus]|uniref:Alanyl-tRNA editing protein Aarsd1-B-like n=1 Tax=Priapulus caudatus TaxID=37621 RepID=A0ABM1EN50_PRICU|nr:PREDICTED: alanyl-tRNA editing protein Aarsd1-B-like [Priapulus caudatus]